jgi:hypothetical protein
MLDLRYPMGMMFALVGAVLAVYGFLTNGDKIYAHSLGINVNLYWGFVLIGFGLIMLVLAFFAPREDSNKP